MARRSFIRSRLPAHFAFGVLLLSAVASAQPLVAVGEFADASGKGLGTQSQRAIVAALGDAGAVELLPPSKLNAAAGKKKLKARDLQNPKVAAPLAASLGAQAFVYGKVFKKGRDLRINVSIHDPKGKELWSKEVGLESTGMSEDLAGRFAAAVAAAVGASAPPKPKVKPPPEPEPEPQPEVEEEPAPPPPPPKPKVKPPPEPVVESEPPPKPREGAQPKVIEIPHDGEEAKPEEPEPPRPAGELARPRLVSFSVGGGLTWRSFDFCPEVTTCDATPPAGAGAPVRYTTDQPFGVFKGGVDLFPLHAQDNYARGLGVGAEYLQSLALQTRYRDVDKTEKTFGSTQRRILAEGVYRLYYRLEGMGDGYVGARVGLVYHGFIVDPNPKIVSSSRLGLHLTGEGAVPLNRFVSAELRFSGVPLASPGDEERKVYGAQASGGGFMLDGGLATDFGNPDGALGLAAMFDMIRFGDRYANNPGTRPEFGRALESYLGGTVVLRARY